MKTITKYNKICEKIEQLNQEAFELEKQMIFENSKKGLNKEIDKTNKSLTTKELK